MTQIISWLSRPVRRPLEGRRGRRRRVAEEMDEVMVDLLSDIQSLRRRPVDGASVPPAGCGRSRSDDCRGGGKSGRALVTGSARGLGRAIVAHLGGAGYEVAVHYRRNRARAEEAAAAIRDGGGWARIVSGDVTRPDDVKQMAGEVERTLGGADMLRVHRVHDVEIVSDIARLMGRLPRLPVAAGTGVTAIGVEA